MPRKPRNRNGAAPPPAKPPIQPAPLFGFTADYFQILGAQVESNSQIGAETMRVTLPASLTDYFGQPILSLCFHSDGLAQGHELVAHGSRIFDRMMGYLEGRSAFAVQCLPLRVSDADALMRSLHPVNASVHDLHIHEQRHFLFLYYWRVTYRADDKRQEIFTVLLDQEGKRLPLCDEPGAPADAVDLASMLADTSPLELERNEEGHLLPPKLPPLTQLVRLAETARRYAIYHADLSCVTHEAEILPRLHRTLQRLTSYYQQQIEEVYEAHDPDGEKRRVLMDDLNRKIAEEVENHRLRVQVELIGYVALQQPMAVLEMTLTDGVRSAPVRVLQNQTTGILRRPLCYACSAPLTTVALDKHGHLTCDACIRQCAACQEIVCPRCGPGSVPSLRQGELRQLRRRLPGLRRARLHRSQQPLPSLRRRGLSCLSERLRCLRRTAVSQPSARRLRARGGRQPRADLRCLRHSLPRLSAVFGDDRYVQRQRPDLLPQLPGRLHSLREVAGARLLCARRGRSAPLLSDLHRRLPWLRRPCGAA
jgi:hypothetical protein